jgi:dTDP-glucose 4,6-dehydratase
VDDHCKAVDLVTQKGILGEVYNIGGRNERRNIDIVKLSLKLVREMTGEAVDETLIRHVTDRKGHDRRYAIDPRKIESELGYAPEFDFDTGIRLTIDWYLNHRDWMSRVVSGAYRGYYETMYANRGTYGKI